MNLKLFFYIFRLSFYSSTLYIEVAQKWKHWGLNYLLKLSILVTFIATITLSITVTSFEFNNPTIIKILDQIPELEINNNIAKFANDTLKSPIRIKPENLNKDLIIVDLDISSAAAFNQDSIIFTSDRITFNLQGSSIEIYYTDLLHDTGITKLKTDTLLELLKQGKSKLITILIFLAIPLGSLLCFIFILIKAAFYASIASIILRFTNGKLNFKQLTRIAILSVTPSIIISTFISLFFIKLSLNPITQGVISYIYIFYFVYFTTICNRHAKNLFS